MRCDTSKGTLQGRATVLAMRTRGRYALLILLTLAATAVAACSASAGQARATSAPPAFDNAGGATLDTYVAGKTIRTYSFCEPAPRPGRSCGGPFAKNQVNPLGPRSNTFAMGHGPYYFLVRKGFLPSGLVLHTNGLLTGTVLKYTAARRWSFDVCVSATNIQPNVGEKGSTCIRTSIIITKAAPTPNPTPTPTPVPATDFSGQWHGTYSASLTSPEGCTFQTGDSATFSITQTGTSLSGTIVYTNGTVNYDTSSCAITSHSVENLSFSATVVGLTASGTTSGGGSSVKLTMAADLSSFSGGLQSACCTSTINVVRG